MTSFLDTINYSAANEDSGSECRALRLGPSDTVLCITGSGARPLSLLTQRPGRVVSVDMNPCQNHLLRLKVAAFQHLDYDALLAFLGVTPSSQRVATYRRLRTNLPSASRTFWDQREVIVTEGVLYAGRWERHFRLLAQAVGWARPRLRHRLFDCRTMDEQAVVWDRWSRGAWSPFLRLATMRLGWRHVLRDPAFYEHVPPDFSIGSYVAGALHRAAGSFLFRDSAFATLLFFGRYHTDGPLPLYLQREHFDTVRSGLDSLRIVDGSLTDALSDAETELTAIDRRRRRLVQHLAEVEIDEAGAAIDVWHRLADLESEAEELATERQRSLHEPSVRADRALWDADEMAFYEYLYGDVDVPQHPLLSEIADLIAAVREDRDRAARRIADAR